MSRRFFLPLLTLLLVTLSAADARAQNSERDRETYNPATNTADITGQVRLAGALTPVQGIRVSLERIGGGQLDLTPLGPVALGRDVDDVLPALELREAEAAAVVGHHLVELAAADALQRDAHVLRGRERAG